MQPLTLDQIKMQQKALERAFRSSHKAQKAMKKSHRKLKQAMRSSNLTEIRILLGMAHIAIDKAEAIAKLSQPK